MKASPSIRGFTHVSLSVSDLTESLAFYRDLLGLAVLREPFDGEAFRGHEAMVLAGRTALCLQQHDDCDPSGFDHRRPGLDHFALAVESTSELTRFAELLSAHGVSHSGVKALPGYGHIVELRDPDGILVELHATND
jgi:catechol 2,3-dioxygenase-like lactoylglutathione lyase family enzyme